MSTSSADRQGEGVKFVLGILMVILILLQLRLWKGTGSLEDINRLQNRIETQQAENAVLTERNEVLRGEVSDLKTGLDSIEERARSELGLIKKGETFYLIIDADENVRAADSAVEEGAEVKGDVRGAAGVEVRVETTLGATGERAIEASEIPRASPDETPGESQSLVQ